jgi:hypothetical protein
MGDADQTLTPSAFLQALEAGPDKGAAELVLRGTARPAEGADRTSSFLFDPTGTCSRWVTVPISAVVSVDLLGRRPCGDHDHAFVALHFGELPAEAQLFAELAVGAQSPPSQALRWRPRSVPSFRRLGPGRQGVPAPVFANNIPGGCAAEFGQAAHSFLSAFEAAGAGDQAGAAAWVDQFQTDYAIYQACVTLASTLP